MEALEMERPMDNWNDDRLDELSRRMDAGFKEMREGFARMDERFQQVDQRFGTMVTREEMKELIVSINGRFERLEDRVDRLYYGCVALVVLLVGNAVASAWF
jgi:archaellum component FlaC